MAANSDIGELFATTFEFYNKTLADNVLNHNALLNVLSRKGNVKPTAGGRTIQESLMYGSNQTVAWFSGYDTIDTSYNETIDAAVYNWKELAGTTVFNGLEELQNMGEHEKFNLVESRLKVLEKSLQNTAATAVYADGTGNSGKEFGGLGSIIADAGTGTVGGIDSSTYTWWKNQISATAATSSGNILSRMNTLWLLCLRGSDKPDVITADSSLYTDFEGALQQYQRFSDPDMATAGFETIKYKTANVYYDDQCTTKRMYFCNTDYLFLRHDPRGLIRSLGRRDSINQDATVIPSVLRGNLTCSNRSLQGVLIKT